MTYLDNAACMELLPGVADRIGEFAEHRYAGHPKSLALTPTSKNYIDLKEQLSVLFGVPSNNILVTYSGSNANVVACSMGNHYMYSKFKEPPTMVYTFYNHPWYKSILREHDIVLDPKCFVSDYVIKDEDLQNFLHISSPTVLCDNAVNSITGQYTDLVGDTIKKKKTDRCFLVVDFQQAMFKPHSQKLDSFDWDAITINATKFGGPLGIAFTVFKDVDVSEFADKYYYSSPFSVEGTLAALDYYKSNTHLDYLYEYTYFRNKILEAELKNPAIRMLQPPNVRCNNTTLNVVADKIAKSEVNSLLMYMLDNGVICSPTTACNAPLDQDEYAYYKFNPKKQDMIRLSIGVTTPTSYIDKASELLTAYGKK